MNGITTTSRRAFLQSMAAGAVALSAAGRSFAQTAAATGKVMRGLFPIASTPLSADNKINFPALAKQVEFCRRGKVPGIAWPQIASGWTTLSEAERMEGAEALVAAGRGGDTAVIIGVQSPDFAAVGRYAKAAQKLGADGLVCIPPAGVTDEKKLLEYYQAVGRMTPLPLFTQAIGSMSIDLIVSMYETIPTMRYLKDESGEPLERIAEIRRRTGDKVGVFSGRGVRTMITEMERGFAGHCPYVSLSDVYQSAYEAWQENRRDDAFRIFGAIQAASSMFAQSSPEALVARGVFPEGTTLRMAPPADGEVPATRYMPASTAAEIRRVLDTYMKPYLRA